MIKFIPLLLLWIFSLYLTSWIHTNLRAESVLINTGKKLNKVLFFINPSGGISIVSIISGLFAHFSLFVFIALLIFLNNGINYNNMDLDGIFFIKCRRNNRDIY